MLFKIQGKTQEDLAVYWLDMTFNLSNIFPMISMQFIMYYCILLMNYWNYGSFFPFNIKHMKDFVLFNYLFSRSDFSHLMQKRWNMMKAPE